MRLRAEVTSQKLRGGYYTPDELVRFCWNRVFALTMSQSLRVLEPSAGDGRFFRQPDALGGRVADVVAVELDGDEAARCSSQLSSVGLRHVVHSTSFLSWSLDDQTLFDTAVGNPPFVRFQFVSEADRTAASMLGLKLRSHFEGVSNLWMPILLGALGKLRIGGVASFVVPAELFTGISAGTVRDWILDHMEDVSIDVFPPGKFPDVLQQVVVLSARRVDGARATHIRVSQHQTAATPREWIASVARTHATWTTVFLEPEEHRALAEASALAAVEKLGNIARLQVSIVTGANDYFCATDEEVAEFGLEQWALPLLPRVRHAIGLVWRERDHAALSASTKRWLVHFAEDQPAPERYKGAARFLAAGVAREIPSRYKCRVRSPWYRVPDVRAGSLLLSKRSHRFPKLILNKARAFTTDTIYRGEMKRGSSGRESDLVASFHNSLTLLTVELEGRSFGGGVLEVVPSEISRLLVPLSTSFGKNLSRLDRICRNASISEPEELIEETDRLLVQADIGLTWSVVGKLAEARRKLMERRLARVRSELDAPASELVAV